MFVDYWCPYGCGESIGWHYKKENEQYAKTVWSHAITDWRVKHEKVCPKFNAE